MKRNQDQKKKKKEILNPKIPEYLRSSIKPIFFSSFSPSIFGYTFSLFYFAVFFVKVSNLKVHVL